MFCTLIPGPKSFMELVPAYVESKCGWGKYKTAQDLITLRISTKSDGAQRLWEAKRGHGLRVVKKGFLEEATTHLGH